MGRIKSKMIKRSAKEINEKIGGFSCDFDYNKNLLKNTMPYKSMRNKIAGMLVRISKESENKSS